MSDGCSESRAHRRQFLAVDEHLHLFGVDGFALQQGRGDAVHRFGIRFDQPVRRLIGLVDQAANFQVDLPRRLFAEVAVLRDFAAQEDLLLLLAEGERSQAAHAVLADHAPGQIRSRLNVAARAGGHLVEEDLLGHASAVCDGQIGFQILLGVIVPVAGQERSSRPEPCRAE